MKIVKTYGKSLLLAAMALGIGSAAFASPTSDATAGLFSTETDDIQSVTDFSGVEFESWLAGSNFHKGSVDAGFAKKIGGIVIAPWYKGYMLSTNATRSENESVSALTAGSTYKNGTSASTTDTLKISKKFNSDFAVLLGINDLIGVKLGYTNKGTNTSTNNSSPLTTVTAEDGTLLSKSGTVYDDDNENGANVHNPYLNLGANLALSDTMTLKPEVDFGFRMTENFERNSYKTVIYPESASSYTRYYNTDSSTKQNDLLPAVGVTLELGDAAESFKHTFNLGWSGTFSLFNDDDNDSGSESYSYTDESYSRKSYNDYSDHAASSNTFVLGYALEKEMEEGFTLKGGIGLKYNMSHELTSYQSVNKTTRTTSYGDGTEEVRYTTTKGNTKEEETNYSKFAPSLAGGVQYMVTEKLRFNGGVGINLPALSMRETTSSTKADGTTYTKTVYRTGNISENTRSNGTSSSASDEKKAEWSSVSGNAAIGFTFLLSDNFSIDAAMGYNLGSTLGNCGNLSLGALLKY
jgi:hypothetical protein